MKTLNGLLSFSIYLLDDKSKEIIFEYNEKKISILSFKICFCTMNRKLEPTKSTQQIKEGQINFLPENVKKSLEESKKKSK